MGVLIWLFASLVSVHYGQGQIVDTLYGPVEGHQVVIDHYGYNVTSFLGVPFGRSTAGALRFEKPQPPEPWQEVFVADTLGYACPQTPGVAILTHPGWDKYSEDCLNMNIYVPSNLNPAEPYPVMIYFYGGGYGTGLNIQYPGYYFAARDVIAVTPNYRIGILGFSTTGDSVNPGNVGMYDQILAMKWVRDNIANFGGDPNRVTIFGQSAGATSVGLHILSPESQGLFHAAIEESGCDNVYWAANWPHKQPWTFTQQVAEKFDCPIDDSQLMMDCLKTVDVNDLVANQSVNCDEGVCGHKPVVDGIFLTGNPLELRKNGSFSKVPLMSGYNEQDGALTVIALPGSMSGGFNRTAFLFYMEHVFLGPWRQSVSEETFEDVLRATDFFYTPWPYIYDEGLNRQALIDLSTDTFIGYQTDRQVRSQAVYQEDTYFFIFSYRSTNTYNGSIYEGIDWAGTFHFTEVPYVFGWAFFKIDPEVRRDSKIFIDVINYNEEDFAYAELMIDLWTNFAKYHNPTPVPVSGPLGDVTWPKFANGAAQYLFIDNAEIAGRIDYRQQHAAFFREYISYIVGTQIYSGQTSTDNQGRPAYQLKENTYDNVWSKVLLKSLLNIETDAEAYEN